MVETSDKTLILCFVFLFLVVCALGYATIKQNAYDQRQEAYRYCIDDEMREGHGGWAWHGPNLMPRYSHAIEVCNPKFKEAYGIEIWEDRVL